MQMVLWDIEEDSSVNLGEQANDQLALSIRGGGLAYDEYPIHAAVAGQKRPPKNLMLLFGRQGYTGIGATWSELVEGVAWLLGKDNQTKHSDPSVHIAMDLFQCGIDAGTGKITSIQYLQSREGRFYLDADGYVNRPDDEFHKFIMENMTLNHWYQGRRCFVRHVRDIRPKSFMPDATGESTIEVALSLKDSPQERTVYMRITPSPTQYNSPSQYHPEFYRALSVLLTDEHAWMSLSIRSGSNPPVSSQKIMCFGQDMPQEILQAIPANIVGNITVTIEARDLDDVAVITPRSGYAGVVQNTEINDMHGISEMIVDYCLETNASKTLVKYVELWIPACAYHGDFNANPVIDHYEDGRPISDQHQWHEDISRIKHQEEGDFKKGFSIWGRPVFIEYTLRNAFDSAEPQECVVQDLLELDLATFKALVSEYLFPQRYDGYNRNHQLLLDQGDPGDDPAFVVRFDTTVKDWEHIKRRIASNSIYIRIVKPEERCEMEVATKWSESLSSQ